MNASQVAAKIWNLCNVLRGDGVSYHRYISELTYLLFLKIARENGAEGALPVGYRWRDLVSYNGKNLLGHYQELLTHLGATADSSLVRDIYSFPTTVFSHSENLRAVIDGLNSIEWHSLSRDALGEIYEALLSKNSEDARSGAGQYFTPRALVDCMVQVVRPRPGELIQDPSAGTGGFLIAADQYIRHAYSSRSYRAKSPSYEGMEIEQNTYRLCLMNVFLHEMQASVHLGDALTSDAACLSAPDVIFANPPFGTKSGSARARRADLQYVASNKQLDFLQHIYRSLKPGGRAAVVVPDNVLFESGTAKQVRLDLMSQCALTIILRLPTGIFYAQGVRTSVLFFAKRGPTTGVWVHDLRSNAPRFGKRTSLTEDFFADFLKCIDRESGEYLPAARGTTPDARFFTRVEIDQAGGSLDLRWADEHSGKEADASLLDIEELAETIRTRLQCAINDIESFQESLGLLDRSKT